MGEAVEFLGLLGLEFGICVLLLSMLSFLYHFTLLNYACRKTVRGIELTGTYTAASVQEAANKSYYGVDSITGIDPADLVATSVSAPTAVSGNIQLGNRFSVTLSKDFALNFFSIAGHTLTIPMETTVQGVSEQYFP